MITSMTNNCLTIVQLLINSDLILIIIMLIKDYIKRISQKDIHKINYSLFS